jgi:hypothetical protein
MTIKSKIHEQLQDAFHNYFKYHSYFEDYMTDNSGIHARTWLKEIRKLAFARQKEIQEIRLRNKKLRNGKNGKPLKNTYFQ